MLRSKAEVLISIVLPLLMITIAGWSQWPRTPDEPLNFAGIYSISLVSDSLGGVFIPGTSADYVAYCTWVDEAGRVPWERWIQVAPRSAWSSHDCHSIATEPGCFVMTIYCTWITAEGDTINDQRVQKISSDGELMWPDSGVAITSIAYRAFADSTVYIYGITEDSEGGVFVLYADVHYGYHPPFQKPYVQRISADGECLWGANGIPVLTEGDGFIVNWGEQYSPYMFCVSDGLGGIIISYENFSDSVIVSQRLSPDGEYLWDQPGVIIRPPREFILSNMVSDGHNGAIITLHHYGQPGSAQRLEKAIRINANGQLLWNGPNGLLISQCPSDGAPASDDWITQVNDTTFFFNWATDVDYEPHPHAQSVSLSGQIQWETPGVQVSIGNATLQTKMASVFSENSAIFCWRDDRAYEDQHHSIRAQRLDVNGNRLWGDEDVVLLGKRLGYAWDMETDMRGGAIVFTSNRYMMQINRNGELGVVLTVPGVNKPILPGVVTFSLFPNPANSEVSVSVLTPQRLIDDLMLSDLTGRVLFRFQPRADQFERHFNISDLSSGTYFFTVKYDGNVSSKALEVVK